MLHGIGGRTIAEAKERLTYDEFVSWAAYIRKRGTLHFGMRLEIGFGQVLAAISRAAGGQGDPLDFMPHLKAEPLEDTPENLAKLMRGEV